MKPEISEEELEKLEMETELDHGWLSRHLVELAKEHAGEHVAVIDQKPVAFGGDFSEAYNKAKRKFAHRVPLVGYIPREGDELLLV